MSVQTRPLGVHARDAVVVDLPGGWPARSSTPWNQLDLIAGLARSAQRLVLDLRELECLDGETAASLVSLHRIVESPGTQVALVATANTAVGDMALSRLRGFYPIHDSIDAAVESISR